MTKTQPYIFKKDNKDQWQYIRHRLEADILKICIDGNEDFQIEIKPYSKRSQNALAAYWCLIGAVVKWDSDNNGYKKDFWDEWFKREAGLIEEVDLMPMWKMIYKKELEKGYIIYQNIYPDFDYDKDVWILSDETKWGTGCDESDDKFLGEKQHIQKTRSLSNKGDITKTEMERLINTILKFGADNEIPNCFIKDGELERLLKFRGWRDEG